MSDSPAKRFANIAMVLAIIWGSCFLITLPFGLSDLKFSLVFATVLALVIPGIVGLGKLFRRGRDSRKRPWQSRWSS